MDPLYINFDKLEINYDNILNIYFTMDSNCSLYDSFYVYSDFKEYLNEYKKPSSLTKEGMKWYNWMNNQKIHYHKEKYHLKHEEHHLVFVRYI